MNRVCLVGLLLGLVAVSASCGSASLTPPPYLEVQAFLPEDGASSIGVDVEPVIHFTGEVDPSSVTASSVYLETAPRTVLDMECEPNERERCECDPWLEQEPLPGQRQVEGSRLVFKPDAALAANRCYRISCTTAVRGTKLGPLEDLRWPASCREKIGAHAVFCTPE